MDYQGNSSLYSGQPQTYIEWIQSITWQTWLIVALVLAILGFNIFYYLAKGTQDIHNLLAPILNLFGQTVAGTTQQALNTAAVGVSGTTHALNNGLEHVSALQQPITQNASNPLANVMNTAGITTVNENNTYTANLQDQNNDIEAVQASSSIHKEGWCYIGEEQGYRSCAQVGVNDQCMSGDIFPTKDICVNPNLRQ
jgi:hypothetical protein